jgi:ADP-ribose pyrophosphatase
MRPEGDLPEEVVWEGRFIAAKKRGKWEYVSRTRNIGAAVIVAVHEGQVILVEQYRVPIGAYCLELPAGLIGDEEEGEEIEAAAIRELEEETGWRAKRMVDLGRYYASSGMSSEGFTLLRADGLTKVGEGGGVEGEDIVVHHVPIAELPAFAARKRGEGCAMDAKLLVLLGGTLLSET